VRSTPRSALRAAALTGVALGALLVPASPAAAAAECDGGRVGSTGWYGPCVSPPDGHLEIRVVVYCRNVLTGAFLSTVGPWVPWNQNSVGQCYFSGYTAYAVGGQSR
jgi:hypothetical protein